MENNITISFLGGPKVEIIGDTPESCDVAFINGRKQIEYQTQMQNNTWAAVGIKYYVPWKIEVKHGDTVIMEETLNLADKRVKIYVAGDLQDVLSITDLLNEFQLNHKCVLDCIIPDDDLKIGLNKVYKNISFHSQDVPGDHVCAYKIARFGDEWQGWTRSDSKNSTLKEIAQMVLGFDTPIKADGAITLVTAHPNNPHRVGILKETLSKIKTKTILSTNHSVDEEVQKMCDYVIYDKVNALLTEPEFYTYHVGFFHINADGSRTNFKFEHSYAVYRIISNGLELANSLGYSTVHYYDYDCQLNDETLSLQTELLKEYDCVVYLDDKLNHGLESYYPACWAANVKKVLPFFRKYKTKWDYYLGGAGPAPCAFLDIKFSHGIQEMKLNVKTLPVADLLKDNKINMVYDAH